MVRTPSEFSPLLQARVDFFRKPHTTRRLVFFLTAGIRPVGDRTVPIVWRLLSLVERFVLRGVVRRCGEEEETVDDLRGKRSPGKPALGMPSSVRTPTPSIDTEASGSCGPFALPILVSLDHDKKTNGS
jgi:hypothetical protein